MYMYTYLYVVYILCIYILDVFILMCKKYVYVHMYMDFNAFECEMNILCMSNMSYDPVKTARSLVELEVPGLLLVVHLRNRPFR